MKEGWDYKKLGEVTSTINGLWTGKKPPFINIAVVRNTNFTKDCKLDMTNVAYLDVEEKQFSTRKLQYGDIIIEKSGGSEKQPVGRPVLFNIKEGNYSFSNFTSTLRINNKSELDPHFLHYSLLGAYFRGATSKMQAKTTGIHNLDFKAYLRLLIPIPTIEEQQQIVSELDLLSGVIEKQKAQLEELDKLAQSIFYGMFSKKEWDCKKIKDIAIVKIGPFESALHQHDYISGGTPLVNPIHMKDGRIEADSNFTISDEKKKELSSYLLKIHDIVFGRRGDIGRCALVTQKENGFLCGTGSLFVRFTININPLYTLKILSSSSVKQYLLENARGATMLNLNSSVFEGISIPLPPLSLQQEFAAKVEAIEAMKAKVRLSLKEAETLFNSRMDYYFN